MDLLAARGQPNGPQIDYAGPALVARNFPPLFFFFFFVLVLFTSLLTLT